MKVGVIWPGSSKDVPPCRHFFFFLFLFLKDRRSLWPGTLALRLCPLKSIYVDLHGGFTLRVDMSRVDIFSSRRDCLSTNCSLFSSSAVVCVCVFVCVILLVVSGAINLPVLSDQERVVVGTLYKQDPFAAKKIGAALVARNIASHLERGKLETGGGGGRERGEAGGERGGEREGGGEREDGGGMEGEVEVEGLADRPKAWSPLVYCWRGGQRSGSLTTVMRQVGWRAR